MRAVDWKKIVAITGIGIVVYAGMRYLLPAAVPFLLGWLLASMVLPAAKWIEKRCHIRRGIAGGILIGLLTAVLALGIWKLSGLLVEQIKELLIHAGLWAKKAKGFLDTCCHAIEDLTGIGAEDSRQFLLYQIGRIQEEVQNKMGTACLGYLVTLIKGIVALLGGILVIVIFGTLVIKDMDDFRKRMEAGKFTRRILSIGRKICAAGGRYLKAQCVLMGIVAAVCILGLWILGNRYFVVGGLVIGFLDALPLIGTGTILIPWALLLCIQGKYGAALGYLLLYLTADMTRQFLEPKMLGKQMGMHPAVMLIAVYGGFFLYGFAGFFLGPVTVLVIRTVCEESQAFWEEEKENFNKKSTKKL